MLKSRAGFGSFFAWRNRCDTTLVTGGIPRGLYGMVLQLQGLLIMAQENRVSIVITAQQKADILAAIAALKAKLTFTIGLTMDERTTILKLGDKSVAFDKKCTSYMAARPDLIPPFIDVAELNKDRAALDEVNDIQRALNEVNQALADTATQIGHEIILPDFSYYNNVGFCAKNGVAGAQAIYDDLSERFPGRKGKAKATRPPTP
jgi:hypothetical protein